MRLGIFGTGYAGLVTAVGLAEVGHTVTAIDKDPDIVARLSDGTPHIHEPGLQELLTANLEAGKLRFSTRAEDVMSASDIIFLCVGTPPRADGRADLSQVEEVSRTIAQQLDGYKLIVEKSPVPARTAYWIDTTIRRLAGPEHEFDVASNPEFLREGSAVRDFLQPDRIVIGADTDRARSLLLDLYEELGVDVATVARGIGLDPRIGSHFLNAGLGFGGSCLPKDLSALIKVAEGNGVDVGMLREVERINTARVDRLLAKVERALWVVRNKVIAVFGVAFKPDTDDIRGAPSLGVVPRLHGAGAILRVYDPAATRKLERLYPPDDRLTYVESAFEAVRDAHALVILTDWEEFRSLDLGRVRSLMRTPIVVDGRNLFELTQMQAAGFEYYSLGRGEATFLTEPKRVRA